MLEIDVPATATESRLACPLLCRSADQASVAVEHLWAAYHRYTSLGEREHALRSLRAIVRRTPLDLNAWATLGDVLVQAGEYGSALVTYEAALSLDPDCRRVLLSKAHCTSYAGDPGEALALLTRLSAKHPEDVEILTMRGQLEAHLKDFDAAKQSFARALSVARAPTPQLWVSLGIACSGLARHHDAVDAFHRALSLELAQAAERWGISQHLSSFSVDAASVERTEGQGATAQAPVVVVTLPKSATLHIEDTLCVELGVRAIAHSGGGYFPNVLIAQHALLRAVRGRGFLIGHFSATRENLALIRHCTDRMVLHLRDPRQALLSFAHFFPAVLRDLDPAYFAVYEVPPDYLERPFANQLDWLIDHYMPLQIEWIDGWVRAIDAGAHGLQVKVTTFERFRDDPGTFYAELLTFCGRESGKRLADVRAREGVRNYRSGKADEWRQVLSAEQAARSTAQIPESWLERFGWSA